MVDQSNLDAVNRLNDERNKIMRAMDMLHEDGARITNMVVGVPNIVGAHEDEETGEQVGGEQIGWIFSSMLDTEYMEYPPQMRDMILDYFGNRIIEIANELNNLGLTGIEEPRPRTPDPQPASKSKTKTKRRAA